MPNEIATSQTFQEKMFTRIRDSIGDLMPDEDLKKIVASAIEKAFFERRTTKDSYGYTNVDKEPILVELIRNQMQAAVNTQVTSWLADNKDKVALLVEKVVSQGIVGAALNYLTNWAQQPLWELENKLKEKAILE